MFFVIGIFFLIIVDDYLLMAIVMGLIIWDIRKKNLKIRGN
jgi:hypothetical protein